MIRLVEDPSKIEAEEYLAEFISANGGETANNIAQTVEEALVSLGVEKKKVLAMVGDGASTMGSAAKKLKVSQVVCAAHRTNSAVKRSLKHSPFVAKLLNHCRLILEHFARSISGKSAVYSLQATYTDHPRKLIGYSETRWDSYYDALLRLIENAQALDEWYETAKPTMPGLTGLELQLLLHVVNLLGECKCLTTSLTEGDESRGPVPIFEVLSTLFEAIASLLCASKNHLRQWYCSHTGSIHPSTRIHKKITFSEKVDEIELQGQCAAFALSLAQALAHYFINEISSRDYGADTSFSMELAAAVFDRRWGECQQRILDSLQSLPSELTAAEQSFENWWRDNCGIYLTPRFLIEEPRIPKRVVNCATEGFKDLKSIEMEELGKTLALFGRNMMNAITTLKTQEMEHFRRACVAFGLESDVNSALKAHREILRSPSGMGKVNVFSRTSQRSPMRPLAPQPKFKIEDHLGEMVRSAPLRVPKDWISCAEVSEITSSLHFMAACFAMVSPTSVQIERAFSSATFLDQPSRANLSDDTFSNETLIRVNCIKMGMAQFGTILRWRGQEEIRSSISPQSSGLSTAVHHLSPSLSRKSSNSSPTSAHAAPVNSRRTSALRKIRSRPTASTTIAVPPPTFSHVSNSLPSTPISISTESPTPHESTTSEPNSRISSTLDTVVERIHAGTLSLLPPATAAEHYGEEGEEFESTKTRRIPEANPHGLSVGRQLQLDFCKRDSMDYTELRQMLADGRCGWSPSDVKNLPVVWGLSVRFDVESQFWDQLRKLIISRQKVYYSLLKENLIIPLRLPKKGRNYPAGLPPEYRVFIPKNWNKLALVGRQSNVNPYLGDWPRTKAEIDRMAAENGFKVGTAPGDGSCFFHSMVDVIRAEPQKIRKTKKNWTSREMRTAVVDHIMKNWDTLGPANVDDTPEDKKAWEQQMMVETEWADSAIVAGTASFFNIGIVTWTLRGPPMTVFPRGADEGGKIPTHQTFTLYNPFDYHYEPITPI